MDEEPLTPAQERRMLELLQQAALTDYPNPERIGCPGSDFLKRLAIDRKSIKLTEPSMEHVARCSPCFREFASYRDSEKRKGFTRRAVVVSGATAAAAGFATFVAKYMWPGPGVAGYEHAEIDLWNSGTQRGTDSKAAPRISLPRRRLDLEITLPFASPEGEYEVEVLYPNGDPTGLRFSAKAQIVNAKTTLRVPIDLSSLSPNFYEIGIRHITSEWVPVPVQIR